MSTTENKQLMLDIFSELAKGNGKPFAEAMAEDMQWTWMGTAQWFKTFEGKASVLKELLGPLDTMLTEPFRVVAHRFIADGDYVAVEACGQNTTLEGATYNNKYCWVCRIAEGKLQELNEYMDTELVTAIFSASSAPK